MLYDTIKEICKDRGISIARLERESGLGNATIRGWMSSSPNTATLSKVAAYLGTSIEDLLSGDAVKH